MNQQEQPDEIVISLADFLRICKKSKTKIVRTALLCGLAAMLFAATRPLQYSVEATFKEKAKAESSASGISTLLLLSGEKDNPAIAMFKSKKVISAAIQQLSLQGVLEPEKTSWPGFRQLSDFASLLGQNGRVEYAYLTRSLYPIIKEPSHPIALHGLLYKEDVPKLLKVEVTSPTTYALLDQNEIIGEGVFGTPFKAGLFQFTLDLTPSLNTAASVKTGERYTLTLLPMDILAKGIAKSLKIVADYNANSFLTLKLSYPSRQNASALLNGIMDAYRHNLIAENHKVVAEQIAYLKTRQSEINQDLGALMEKHAEQVSTHAGNLDLLISTQQNLQRRLLSIDLEIKHLQKSIDEGSYLQGHSLEGSHAPPAIYNALAEIQRHKQQCDTLDLLLRHNQRNYAEQQQILEQHLTDLGEIKIHTTQAEELLTSLDTDKPLPTDTELFNSSKYLVRSWQEKVTSEKEHTHNFRDYLHNLLHLLEVQKKTIEDRLTHQQGDNKEFAGIDLETANHLYITYSRELHELEATALQHQITIEKLKDPAFELSALATILNDSVSRDIIAKASATSLTLKDQSNRTTRELERLGQELELQKTFLGNHLFEAKALLHLKIELLKDKIAGIQAAILELTQERISIQEKQLLDHGIAHVETLAKEKAVILQQKQALQDEFDKIPEQWAREKIVDLFLQTQGSLMQQIGNLIESKNIADNIDVTLSTPFDLATPPLHPNAPHILIFTLLGAIVGALASLIRNLIRAIYNGIEATAENLKLLKQHVSGTLASPPTTTELQETFQRLSLFLLSNPAAKTTLLLESHGPSYAPLFAEFLSKCALKVLLLPITLSPSNKNAPLLDYLTTDSPTYPSPQQNSHFDTLPFRLHSNLDVTLLHSSRFQALLTHFKTKYDLILLSSHALPSSATAEGLSSLFDHTIVTVQTETLAQLKPLFNQKNSFLCT